MEFADTPRLNLKIKISPHQCKIPVWKLIKQNTHGGYCLDLKCTRCKKLIGRLIIYKKEIDILKAQNLMFNMIGAIDLL